MYERFISSSMLTGMRERLGSMGGSGFNVQRFRVLVQGSGFSVPGAGARFGVPGPNREP
jgi:hypothetical protein